MFLQKLLNKIPYFRNREIKKIKKNLAEIREDFADGFFNEQYVIGLHNILNNPLITFSDEIVHNTLGELALRTTTSLSAIKLIDRKVYKKSVLERSPLISMTQRKDYFSNWYSNEESVVAFVETMKAFLQTQVLSFTVTDYQEQERIENVIPDHLDLDMLETLLYRLLLEDLVSIVSFYLESKYD